MGVVTYTRDELADMVADGTCEGKLIEFTYRTGQNRDYPLTMEFLHTEDEREVWYMLHNPNSEKYKEPRLMTYDRQNFVDSMRHGHDTMECIRLVDNEIAWVL